MSSTLDEANCGQGISLSLEQYTALLKAIPGINSRLRELGEFADTSEDVEDDAESAKVSKKSKQKPEKSNFDATSDEDED